MELTGHGRDRIMRRTNMAVSDVLAILTANAAVSLGKIDPYEYLLFYSPKEQLEKIAVVDAERTRLISVWDYDYALPKELKKVTKGLKNEAKRALREYLLRNSKKLEKVETKAGIEYSVRIEVRLDRKLQYSSDAGVITLAKGLDAREIAFLIRPHLEPIVKIVDENQTNFVGRVVYEIYLFRSAARPCHVLRLAHKTVFAYFQTASP